MNSTAATLDSSSVWLAAVALLAWVLLHVVVRWLPGRFTHFFALPLTLGGSWFFWDSALAALSSAVETTGSWPASDMAILAALASESVLLLYPVRAASPLWMRVVPQCLRVAMIATLVCILMEPVLSHRDEHSIERHVAVLMDASASMSLDATNTAAGGETPRVSRRQAMLRALLDEQSNGHSLLEDLQTDYDVSLYEYAATAREFTLDNVATPSAKSPSLQALSPWAQITDTAAALRRVDGDLPLDELSGLIFLTDGRDHSTSDLQAASRRLANRGVPVHTVIVGSQAPISDAEVVSLQMPQQIFRGDHVSIRASIKADQLRGGQSTVRLFADGELLDERPVSFTSDRHRQTLTFEHEPSETGIHEYTVELDGLAGEAITENNRATSRLWVSDDHIRMLIVENRPRWGFRYLKNLFAGRDRSVFLQHVLLRPTRLAGVPDPPVMHASVARAFNDCEATALPRTAEEWLKFDVIVLGDVSPADLGEGVMQTLHRFVRNRAGTLIVLSGQNSMPHAFAGTAVEELLPVHIDEGGLGHRRSPDLQYHLQTATGAESHVIMQQSENAGESAEVWADLPELYWRHPASRAKVGATVLAYAAKGEGAVLNLQAQRDRALILWHRFGAGKVLQLTFDQTWRLRYGIGDRHHHKFWGQVLRWSIQDRLPAGTELVRLGTDRTLYRGDETVAVRARLLDQNRTPIESDDTRLAIYLDDELVHTAVMAPTPDSGGMLQAEIHGLERSGKYRAELQGPTVERLLQSEGEAIDVVSTDFAIEGPDPAVELSDVVADATIPLQLADWTDGIVTSPNTAAEILEHLGPKTTFHREHWTVPLWNRWPVIALFLFLASTEWILRRISGMV